MGDSDECKTDRDSEGFGAWRHDERLVISRETGYYNRSCCDESVWVVQALCEAYGVTDGFVTPSGMAAIACALHAACNASNVWLLHSRQLYSDTPRLCAHVANLRKCTRVEFDVTHAQRDLEAAIAAKWSGRKKIPRAVLFVEAASNPASYMLPKSVLEMLRKHVRQLVVIVDNTWLSVQAYNPFRHGADMVVCSLTKYGSGGTTIAGCVLGYGSNKAMQRAQRWRRMHGLHVSPHVHALLLDTLPSQRERVAAAGAVACEIATFLQSQSDTISEVLHLSLPSHPSHAQACEVLTKGMWPGVIAFRVKADKATATAWMRACADIVPHITSFGGPQSRTDPWPRVAADRTTTWCRLAVGFLDTSEALITKLRRMLDRWHTTSVEAGST